MTANDVLCMQLHVAAANGYISVVDLLLEKSVAIDTRDNEGWQPLHAATFWGHVSVCV